MTVRVLYFASLKERAGASLESVELPETADVAALWDAVQARHPRLREMTTRPLAACDMTYASWDRPLRGVLEVAFLPPVSGG
jgi:molybdopterin synthase sulfur carrier subunit